LQQLKNKNQSIKMQKQVKINIADTNLANFGTELEKNVKLAAAKTEKAWANAGKTVGVEIWRIEKFQVVPVPKESYGTFYNGDSYIVLKTYKVNDALKWDVHFWLGEFTTQDEAGTAAYKTVELDDLLGGAPVQYREVSHHESDRFVGIFTPPGLRVIEGGVESGFNHVKPEEYQARLLHIKGRGKNIAVSQVSMEPASLNSGDVFILDAGLRILTWIGKEAGASEKNKGATLARALDDERGGKPTTEVFNEGDKDATEFWKHLGGEGKVKTAKEGGSDDNAGKFTKVLFHLSDASGKLTFKKIAEGGDIKRSQLDSTDVFILDSGAEVYSWIGKGANDNERKSALQFAQKYLTDNGRPAYLPIVRVLEGAENEVFESHLN